MTGEVTKTANTCGAGLVPALVVVLLPLGRLVLGLITEGCGPPS